MTAIMSMREMEMGESGTWRDSAIILVSTRTIDCLPDVSGGGLQRLPGGPAHYIGHALELQKVPYELITGAQAVTEVVRTAEGDQQYIIPALPRIDLSDKLTAPAVILSPIMQEIDPNRLPEVEGLVAVDLQGFVREPGIPSGSSPRTYDLRELLERADVVKAAPDELARLTEASRSALSRTMLLTTEGASGVRLQYAGRSSFISAYPVEAAHTIGAGDTFLGAFVPALLDGCSPEDAAERAARFTEDTLRTRSTVANDWGEARTEA